MCTPSIPIRIHPAAADRLRVYTLSPQNWRTTAVPEWCSGPRAKYLIGGPTNYFRKKHRGNWWPLRAGNDLSQCCEKRGLPCVPPRPRASSGPARDALISGSERIFGAASSGGCRSGAQSCLLPIKVNHFWGGMEDSIESARTTCSAPPASFSSRPYRPHAGRGVDPGFNKVMNQHVLPVVNPLVHARAGSIRNTPCCAAPAPSCHAEGCCC